MNCTSRFARVWRIVAVVALGQTVQQPTAFANGGTVQWRKQAGSLLITVFTTPAPLSAGPVVISLLVQNRNGLEPVLDANVSLLLRADTSTAEIRAQTDNKIKPILTTEQWKKLEQLREERKQQGKAGKKKQ